MKVSTSFCIFSLLLITFALASSFPEEKFEDKEKITQSFTKHFDGDSEAQSRLFWGSYWKNKATASIQRLKEALDRLSENIRELTDKRFFFGGNKQSDEPSDTKDDEDAKNDDPMDSEDDDTVTDNSLSGTTKVAVKRKGDAVDKQIKQKDDKMDTIKEETSLIREEIVKKEEKKELERKVMKEMENDEKVKDEREEMKEVKEKEEQKETQEVRKQVKKEEMENEEVMEEKRKEEIQNEDSKKEEKQNDEVVRLNPENVSIKDQSNEVNGETVKDENTREEE